MKQGTLVPIEYWLFVNCNGELKAFIFYQEADASFLTFEFEKTTE